MGYMHITILTAAILLLNAYVDTSGVQNVTLLLNTLYTLYKVHHLTKTSKLFRIQPTLQHLSKTSHTIPRQEWHNMRLRPFTSLKFYLQTIKSSFASNHFHITHLHDAPKLTQAVLAQSYWILPGQVIRSRVFKCVQSFNNKSRNTVLLLGDLPSSRITPSHQFSPSGWTTVAHLQLKLLDYEPSSIISKSILYLYGYQGSECT